MLSQTNHDRPAWCRNRPTHRAWMLGFLSAVMAGALSLTSGCELDLETCEEEHGECLAQCLEGDVPCQATCFEHYELCVEVFYLVRETDDWGED
jgi:hypothetical protein